jgi:signal transduction histidine kinase
MLQAKGGFTILNIKGWRLPARSLPAATELRQCGQASSGQAMLGSSEESKWAARLVGAGSLLTLVHQIGYLVLDQNVVWTSRDLPLLLHFLNVGLFSVAVLMTLRVGPWRRRYWKAVAFAFSTLMIISSVWLAIITAEKEPLVIALILFLAGTGPFLSWGEKTQSMLSLIAVIAFAVAELELSHGLSDSYQWLGILIAAAIGLFFTALERRLRRARRRAEEEALKSREMLVPQERIRVAGQLTSGIAHDLNKTLNVIKLRLGALLEDEAIVNKHEVPLRAIERAVDDAALTVARVRELGRNSDRDPRQSSHLSEIITDAIDLARTTIEGNSSLEGAPIRILSRTPASLPKVSGSASELRQVFLNLLLNAYDAINRGGEIIYRLRLARQCGRSKGFRRRPGTFLTSHAFTSSTWKPCASRISKTGIQYTPVDSIAMVVISTCATPPNGADRALKVRKVRTGLSSRSAGTATT